ncbi:MAG: exo-alpha-sialidase [Clostridia bacterium]|nr:exo-alpha-sialidase [Clostridia bacterium]
MNIKLIGKPKTIISNPNSRHGYFAWPTVSLLQDGKIAVGASGFRFEHICPFGKAVISYSFDGGETYTLPAPVIDTPLDDRDAGLCTFGEKGLIFTSFNNSAEMQRQHNKENEYVQSYINTITQEDEEKYLGSLFRISHDCGITFGEIHHSPVTSPHGPTELKNGTVLWAGNNFYNYNDGIEIVSLNTQNGETEFVGKITTDDESVILNEPYLIELPDGKLLCHIRGENDSMFTVFQSFSEDKGKTWSAPEMLLDETGGAPPHLIQLRSGVLLCTYGRRKLPYGIMAMFSTDNGKSWEKDIPIYKNYASDDIGYPSTIELDDGTLITVFYATDGEDKPCKIMQQKWKIV